MSRTDLRTVRTEYTEAEAEYRASKARYKEAQKEYEEARHEGVDIIDNDSDIYVYMSRASFHAVIMIVRKSVDMFGLLAWDRGNDEVTPGQWVRGWVDPASCDLSYDGRYFAYGLIVDETSYTAVSPYPFTTNDDLIINSGKPGGKWVKIEKRRKRKWNMISNALYLYSDEYTSRYSGNYSGDYEIFDLDKAKLFKVSDYMSKYTVVDLKKMLRKEGLKLTGNKEELAMRLVYDGPESDIHYSSIRCKLPCRLSKLILGVDNGYFIVDFRSVYDLALLDQPDIDTLEKMPSIPLGFGEEYEWSPSSKWPEQEGSGSFGKEQSPPATSTWWPDSEGSGSSGKEWFPPATATWWYDSEKGSGSFSDMQARGGK